MRFRREETDLKRDEFIRCQDGEAASPRAVILFAKPSLGA